MRIGVHDLHIVCSENGRWSTTKKKLYSFMYLRNIITVYLYIYNHIIVVEG